MMYPRLLCLAVCCLIGCTPAPTLPKTYPASGTVVYRGGQPMKGGSIQFSNDADPILRVVGQIGSDGSFTLDTVKDARTKGAPEGEYKVTIHPSRPQSDRGDVVAAQKSVPPIVLDEKYKVEAKENTFKIELSIPPP